MKVKLTRTSGSELHCEAPDGRSIVLAGSPEIGPSEAGVRPMQAVLMALGGCSAMDVLLVLQRGRHTVDTLEVEVEGTRADATPAVFTDIHLHFLASGDFSAAKLQRAVDLSLEKYCSVAHMLQPGVRITHASTLTGAPG